MLICTKDGMMINLELVTAIKKDTDKRLHFFYPDSDKHGHPIRFDIDFEDVQSRDGAFNTIHDFIGTNQLDF